MGQTCMLLWTSKLHSVTSSRVLSCMTCDPLVHAVHCRSASSPSLRNARSSWKEAAGMREAAASMPAAVSWAPCLDVEACPEGPEHPATNFATVTASTPMGGPADSNLTLSAIGGHSY